MSSQTSGPLRRGRPRERACGPGGLRRWWAACLWSPTASRLPSQLRRAWGVSQSAGVGGFVSTDPYRPIAGSPQAGPSFVVVPILRRTYDAAACSRRRECWAHASPSFSSSPPSRSSSALVMVRAMRYRQARLGFGAAAAMPLLALVIPLKVLIPAWTLIGLAAGVALLGRDRLAYCAPGDMARLLPHMPDRDGCRICSYFTWLDSRLLARGSAC